MQLTFWDNDTVAIALSRGRVQLRNVGTHVDRASVPLEKTSEWTAHRGPVTCMVAQSWGEKHVSGKGREDVGGSLDDGASIDGSVNTKVLPGDRQVQASSRRERVVLATGGGDGKVRVWTDAEDHDCSTDARGSSGVKQPAITPCDEINESSRSSRFDRARTSHCDHGPCGSCGARAAMPYRGQPDTGHEGAVLCLSWHPSAEILASAGQDWAVWLWSGDGRALSYIHAYHRWTRALAFSSSGDFLVSIGNEGAAGWSVALSGTKQEFKICWRRPCALVSTHADVSAGLIDHNTGKLEYARNARIDTSAFDHKNEKRYKMAGDTLHHGSSLLLFHSPMHSSLLMYSFVLTSRCLPIRCNNLTLYLLQLCDAVELSEENAHVLRDNGASPAATTAAILRPHERISCSCCSQHGPKSMRLSTSDMYRSTAGTASDHSKFPLRGVKDADWTVDGVKPQFPFDGYLMRLTDGERTDLLMLAAKHGRGLTMNALIAAGADVTATDKRGFAALSWVRDVAGRSPVYSSAFSCAPDLSSYSVHVCEPSAIRRPRDPLCA